MLPHRLHHRLNQLDPSASPWWSTEVDLFHEADVLRRGTGGAPVDQIDALAMLVNQQRYPRPVRRVAVAPAPTRPAPSRPSVTRVARVARVRRPAVALAAALAAASIGVGAAVARQGDTAGPAVAAGVRVAVPVVPTEAPVAPVATSTATTTTAAAIPMSGVSGPAGALGAAGIPAIPLSAYQRAADRVSRSCGLPWWLLAGIGKAETDHAVAGRVDRTGTVRGRIYGPRLDGTTPGTQTLADTDKGLIDGDPQFDRAVGPMQVLPATWAWAKRDGNGDGTADPQNIYDAAQAAAAMLCQAGPISDEASMTRALLRYNPSAGYAKSVLAIALAYRDATTATATANATSSTAPTGPAQVTPAPTSPAATTPASTSPTTKPTPTTATSTTSGTSGTSGSSTSATSGSASAVLP